MKKIILIALFSLLLFSIAIAAIDTSRPGVMMVPRSIILDVSCFMNDARVASEIAVMEFDPATGYGISGTGKTIPARDGRWSFLLTPGKNYKVSAYKSPVSSVSPGAFQNLPNLEHSTAIGLTLSGGGPTDTGLPVPGLERPVGPRPTGK
jgi:hypothetical protein